MDDPPPTRRAFLGTLAGAGGVVAGCQSPVATYGDRDGTTDRQRRGTDPEGPAEPSPYTEVYREVVESVASVRTYGDGDLRGQGSAFVYDGRFLITNAHVVQGTERVAVRFGTTAWIDAEPVAADIYSDLAVVEPEQLPDSATPLPFVDEEPPIGTEVLAVGNPFGFSGSVSAGIVSGTDRNLSGPNDFSIPDTVQTDAPVNPGNSGGPLVTLDGDVVGVVNAGGGDNVGFAISAALTDRVVPELITTGSYDHSYVGVRLRDVTPLVVDANELDVASGVYVHEVRPDGPAEGVLRGSTGEATIEGVSMPVGGDVIRTVTGDPIRTRQDLSTVLALETRPGDTVSVGVEREGSRVDVDLTLGRRPDPE